MRSYCAVPLTTALRRLGALGFGSAEPNAYTASDLEFMQHVAKQVAVAVDNVLHDKSAPVGPGATGARARPSAAAARGEQHRRVAPRHGRDVRGDQRQPRARHSERRLQSAALRSGNAPVPLPRRSEPTAPRSPKKEAPMSSRGAPPSSALATKDPATFGEQALRSMAAESPLVAAATRHRASGRSAVCHSCHTIASLGALNVGRYQDSRIHAATRSSSSTRWRSRWPSRSRTAWPIGKSPSSRKS